MINSLLQGKYVKRSGTTFPTGITALPDVIDEPLKRLGGKAVCSDIDVKKTESHRPVALGIK